MVGRLQCVKYQIVHCESIPSNNKIHQIAWQQLAQLDNRNSKLACAIPGCWAILHSWCTMRNTCMEHLSYFQGYYYYRAAAQVVPLHCKVSYS